MLTIHLNIWKLEQLNLGDFSWNEVLINMTNGTGLDIPLWVDYLFSFYLVFLIGLTGIVFNYKNFLVTMFSIELMYLGITMCFIIVSISTADPKGQIYAILLLVLAAAESAIGLGILIVLYRFGGGITFKEYQTLKS